jgi:uncharacterized protein (DUF885 family)
MPDIDRRLFVAGAAATGLASNALAAPDEAARLTAVLDRIFQEQQAEQPQSMTSLGLDKGVGAFARSRLDRQSRAQALRMIRLRSGWLANLKTIDRTRLTGVAATNYDCIAYDLERAITGARRFGYGRSGFPSPYVLTQINGAYQQIPDFLDTQHVIETKADVEAYLSRLRDFARVLDEETARARADGLTGVTPPAFIIDKTLGQMRSLRATPVQTVSLVESVVRRTRAKAIAGDWAGRATKLVTGFVWPALDRQINLLESWRAKASHDAGVWKLPQSRDYYAFATRYQTTTNMSPSEIHDLGLRLVAELSGAADAVFKANGLNEGSVGQRYQALFTDPRFIYPNTDQGKADLLAYLNGRMQAVNVKVPAYFGTVPMAGLEIRRVPVATEAGAPAGSYQDGSLDGSRPGAYYINLRDTAEVPRWTLPTLTFHEGVPGHHLQGALALEATGLPLIRRAQWFTAYGEGWALYAEQVADEMGLYADDPWGRLGYLHDAIFRAVRLVVDTGLHDKRWSREQSIAYYMDKMGDPEASAATEVERYCVWPGQACSYMIGKITWLKLRDKAQARLGARFDIRKFHDAGLLSGPMPLDLLERHIDETLA